MADSPATTAVPPVDGEVLPLPAIICIAIGGYIVLIVLLLVIRQALVHHGICGDVCNCCGKEGSPHCCECWIGFAETCNCCASPNINACLDCMCPARKKLGCADIILCQCCAEMNCCCNNEEALCDCGNCDCHCNCQPPECQDVNCCCFQISTANSQPPGGIVQTGLGGYPAPY